jgi:hypothetical protein
MVSVSAKKVNKKCHACVPLSRKKELNMQRCMAFIINILTNYKQMQMYFNKDDILITLYL